MRPIICTNGEEEPENQALCGNWLGKGKCRNKSVPKQDQTLLQAATLHQEALRAMNRENRLLVTNEPVELERQLIYIEGFRKITDPIRIQDSKLIKEKWIMFYITSWYRKH